jgi:tetratricopeptide (TPR) repeat protein
LSLRIALRLAAAVALLALASPARADEDAAAKLFDEGAALYRRRQFLKAAQAFEAAYRASPAAAALHSAGAAWEGAKDEPRAADAFAAALAMGGLAPEQAAVAKTRLAVLERKLGRVRVSGPAEVRVTLAHVLDARPPATIHVVPGEHELRAALPGGAVDAKLLTVAAGAEITVELAPLPPPPPPPPPPSRMPPGRLAGLVTLGAGVAGAGAAIGLGVAALHARDRFLGSGNTDAGARASASSLRAATNVTWALAGALAATGVVLIVVAPGGDRAPSAAIGPGSITLRGRF